MSIQTLEKNNLPMMTGFENFFHKRIMQGEKLTPSTERKITSTALKFIGAGLAILGRFTLINVTISYTGSNIGGWLLVSGDFFSFSTLSSWALFKLIDQLSKLVPPELSNSIKKEQTIIYRVSTIAFSILFSLFTKLPQAFVTYEFNNNRIFAPILLLVSNFSLTAFSVKGSIDYIYEKLTNSEVDNKLLAAKEDMIERINHYTLNITPDINCKDDFNQESVRTSVDSLFKKIYSYKLPQKAKGIFNKFVKVICYATGVTLTLSYLYLLSYVAFVGTHTYLKTLAGAIVVAIGVFLGNTYITKTVILDSIYRYVNNILSITRTPLSYYQEKSPILFNALIIIGLAFSLLSWGPIPSTCNEYFSNPIARQFFSITNSFAVITFTLTPTLALINSLVRSKFKFIKTNNSENIRKNESNLKRIRRSVQMLDYKSFAELLDNLNSELKQKIMLNSQLTQKELNHKIGRINDNKTSELTFLLNHNSSSSSDFSE